MSSIRFQTPTLHGVLDYAAATGLIVLPFIFGFGSLALWLSVAGGAGLIGYSLLTDYTLGAAALISFKIHLALDLAAAVAFIAAPFIFGWGGLIMGYYLVMGGTVVVVVALSKPDPTTVSESTQSSAA